MDTLNVALGEKLSEWYSKKRPRSTTTFTGVAWLQKDPSEGEF